MTSPLLKLVEELDAAKCGCCAEQKGTPYACYNCLRRAEAYPRLSRALRALLDRVDGLNGIASAYRLGRTSGAGKHIDKSVEARNRLTALNAELAAERGED